MEAIWINFKLGKIYGGERPPGKELTGDQIKG